MTQTTGIVDAAEALMRQVQPPSRRLFAELILQLPTLSRAAVENGLRRDDPHMGAYLGTLERIEALSRQNGYEIPPGIRMRVEDDLHRGVPWRWPVASERPTGLTDPDTIWATHPYLRIAEGLRELGSESEYMWWVMAYLRSSTAGVSLEGVALPDLFIDGVAVTGVERIAEDAGLSPEEYVWRMTLRDLIAQDDRERGFTDHDGVIRVHIGDRGSVSVDPAAEEGAALGRGGGFEHNHVRCTWVEPDGAVVDVSGAPSPDDVRGAHRHALTRLGVIHGDVVRLLSPRDATSLGHFARPPADLEHDEVHFPAQGVDLATLLASGPGAAPEPTVDDRRARMRADAAFGERATRFTRFTIPPEVRICALSARPSAPPEASPREITLTHPGPSTGTPRI